MAPKREPFFTSQKRCRSLAAGSVLLGVLLCAEYARPARAQPDADARELRSAQLEELRRLVPDLDDDDPDVREDAQLAIYALGFSFRDDVAVCLAGAKSLELRMRLKEVLGKWYWDDLHLEVSGDRILYPGVDRFSDHLNTCPVCMKWLESGFASTSGNGSTSSSGGGYRRGNLFGHGD